MQPWERVSEMGFLSFALNVTLDGCCNHREMVANAMAPQHIDKKGAIHVRQVKTGAALVIPVHSALQTFIDVTVTE